MKNILACAATVVLLGGCASAQEGAPANGAPPTGGGPAANAAPADQGSSDDAFYTETQARRGSGLFRDNCVSCHATSEFTGTSFQRRWRNRAVGDIYEFVLYSMPDDNPGGLPAQTYADIVAYLLQLNDFPAGDTELSTSMEALMEMKLWEDAAGSGDE